MWKFLPTWNAMCSCFVWNKFDSFLFLRHPHFPSKKTNTIVYIWVCGRCAPYCTGHLPPWGDFNYNRWVGLCRQMGKLFNWSKTFVSFSVGIYFVFVTCFSFMNLDLDKNTRIASLSIVCGRGGMCKMLSDLTQNMCWWHLICMEAFVHHLTRNIGLSFQHFMNKFKNKSVYFCLKLYSSQFSKIIRYCHSTKST